MPEPRKRTRPKAEELLLLRLLAQPEAEAGGVVLSSREAGAQLGASQQAADRYLMHLAQLGLLSRTLAGRKQRITLTASGRDLLRKEYHEYRRLFEGAATLEFSGTVSSGLGEGRYYLSRPGYLVQFERQLGYSPFPGTLNIRLSASDQPRVDAVRHWRGTRIEGFEASGRTFGGATCLASRLEGRDCHLILPDRGHYTDVVEFIAPSSLRSVLKLKDGTKVRVSVREA